MTDPRWRRVAEGSLSLLWMAAVLGWAKVFMGDGATGGVVGGLLGASLASWSQKRSRDRADKAYESLTPERRAVVDEALAVGELRGSVPLREMERAVAKLRLDRAGATSRGKVLWSVAAGVLFGVVLVLAPTRPPLLVAVTAMVLVGWAALAFLAPTRHALSPDERRRLKAVSRAPLAP